VALQGSPHAYQSVLISGLLKRPGVIASCLVKADRIVQPLPAEWEYVSARVVLTSPYLPDGEYDLHFEKRVIKVKRYGGQWI
jgi:hypothetical protein